MLITFDIFDTLLYRLCGEPEVVFGIMRSKLFDRPVVAFDKEFVAEFPAIRQGCAIQARSLKHNEASFEEIYAYMQAKFVLSDVQVDYLKGLEFDIERNMLRGMAAHVRMAESFIERGETVVLLSDMYYSAEQLRLFIKPISPKIAECEIVVSSEHDKTKRSGELFEYVRSKYAPQSAEWMHFGDDEVADFSVPSKLGIHAHKVKRRSVHQWDDMLMHKNNPALSVSAGVASSLMYEDEYEHFGALFAGPLLFSFVRWVLRRSRVMGLKKLYFLSRDGWILHEIAKLIMRDEDSMSPQMDYLRVSRQSVVPASFGNLGENRCWDFIFLNIPELNMRTVAARLGVSEEWLLGVFARDGRTYGPDDRVDSFDVAGWIRWSLTHDSETLSKLQEVATCRRRNLCRYLERMGVSDAGVGFVDVGWRGSIQDALVKVLRGMKSEEKFTGLYFGLSEFTAMTDAGNCKFGNAFRPYTALPYPSEVLRFVEIFCHANEGVTLSYTEDGNPVLAAAFAEENAAAVNAIQRGVLRFVEFVEGNGLAEFCDLHGDYRDMMLALSSPGRLLADTMGDYRYLLGADDSLRVSLAPRRGCIGFVLDKVRGADILWTGGYVARLSMTARWLRSGFRLMRSVGQLIKRCFAGMKGLRK